MSCPGASCSSGRIHALHVSLQSGVDVEVDWLGFDALPWEKGAFETHQYRNLFAEMGYKQADIDKKVNEVFNDVFYGKNKVYFEVGDSMGYVSDIKNNDVRTEGMSYGMMAAVQFDKKDIFDRLWRWSKKYMQHQEGPYKGYFAWSCKTDGTRNAQGAASDGELYFVTSLIFASNRWGNDTGINYLKEAQHILDCSMQKAEWTAQLRSSILNISSSPLRPIIGAGSLPTLLTISLPFTRFGRNGLTMDVPSSGRSVQRKAVSSCISVSMRRRA